jgi:hypothetical protein
VYGEKTKEKLLVFKKEEIYLLCKKTTLTMMSRSLAVLALASSAAAFSPMMGMDIGRREIVQAGAAAAAVAPLLKATPAAAKYDQVLLREHRKRRMEPRPEWVDMDIDFESARRPVFQTSLHLFH